MAAPLIQSVAQESGLGYLRGISDMIAFNDGMFNLSPKPRRLYVKCLAVFQEISEVIAERDSSNDARDELPCVLPVQISKLNVREFAGIYKLYSS